VLCEADRGQQPAEEPAVVEVAFEHHDVQDGI
jgi:hypothetical protein